MTETVAYLRRANAGEEEISAVWQLLQMMHAEVGIGALCETKVRAMIDACLDRGAVCAALDDGKMVGTMGLLVSSWWYSEDLILLEQWTFVHPEYRRSMHARNLIAGAKAAAEQIGRPLVAAVTSNVRTAGKCRLYRRLLKPIGQIFIAGEAA